ncbi:hypothetical protein FACS1894116_06170 [Betaproteobacteria bacterium]|nr:hypothetical protein FACS1894116_06170 [Betaproteobacteria bacterium]GHT98253.1 hypothetical protein FACS1894154_03240 [Betaproteobacteria bacterium]
MTLQSAVGAIALDRPLTFPNDGRALTKHGRHSQRQRDLPAHAVAYYAMALALKST